MKIALLNLPYDNNYGGNLQRYALMKVLQDMGHEVTHLNLRFHYYLPWYRKPYSYLKRILLKYIFGRDVKINQEIFLQQRYEAHCAITEPFYQKYIKHTPRINNLRELSSFSDFDAYVVGSDQVWRKSIAKKFLGTMFLDFLVRKEGVKRIAYGISLGNSENELNPKEIRFLGKLYNLFDAVSVREESALSLFGIYGWNSPKARVVLDPTFLLEKSDYLKLIRNARTEPSKGNMFCYILDNNVEKQKKMLEMEQKLGLKSFYVSLQGETSVSVEQWLRSFDDAEYVITDSYHGLLFSIIFNKPFYLIHNSKRGNARFEMILSTFHLHDKNGIVEWEELNTKLFKERIKSIQYLNACNL